MSNPEKVQGFILEDLTGRFNSMFASRNTAIDHKQHIETAYGIKTKLRPAEIAWNKSENISSRNGKKSK